VNDPVLVSGFEGFGDLFQDWQCFFDRYLALRNPIGERGALNQLEDESRQPGRLFETVDVADVLVIQCGEALGFSLKAGDALSVRGKRIGEDLDCDIPIQLRIRARYTSPMPPAPMSATISYEPSRAPATNATSCLERF
jgi:hypothetical protein